MSRLVDKIYFLFRGSQYADSRIHIKGLLTDRGVLKEKTISAVSVLLEPTSKKKCTVRITGSDSFEEKFGGGQTYPSRSTVTKDIEYYPYWGDEKTTWHGEPDSKQRYDWVTPNDFHINLKLENNITDFKHDVELSFKGPQKVKAISLEYSIGEVNADKK